MGVKVYGWFGLIEWVWDKIQNTLVICVKWVDARQDLKYLGDLCQLRECETRFKVLGWFVFNWGSVRQDSKFLGDLCQVRECETRFKSSWVICVNWGSVRKNSKYLGDLCQSREKGKERKIQSTWCQLIEH